MKKQLLFVTALLAVAPVFSAPSALNPKYLLPAIVGVQGEHLKPHNLLQNMAPEAAGILETKTLQSGGKYAFTGKEHYTEASKHVATPMAWKYLLSYATPIGRRSPKGFHRTRMQQLASVLKFVTPEINTRVGDKFGKKSLIDPTPGTILPKTENKIKYIATAVIATLKHVPEIASRRTLANKLAKTGKLVSSWSVPASMRGKKYLMFHGPAGYAMRNLPALLFVAKEIADNICDVTHDKTVGGTNHKWGYSYAATASNKLQAFRCNNLVNALPFLSLTTKYYMLESDYQKLPADDQVAVYQAVYEDVTNFTEKLVHVLAPKTTWENFEATKTWSKEAWKDPKTAATKVKEAGIAKAKEAKDAAGLKYNNFMAWAQSFKTRT